MKAKITNSLIKTLTPREGPYEVADRSMSGFLARVQPTGSVTYYYSYRPAKGGRNRIKVGSHPSITATQARKNAEGFAALVYQGKDPQGLKKEERLALEKAKYNTLESFIGQKYHDWTLNNQKTGADTIKLLETNFGHLYRKNMSEITRWDLESWKIKCTKKGLKPTTINRRLAAFKALLNKAVEWNLIPDNPIRDVKLAKVDDSPKVRFLSEDEENNLRTALKIRDSEIRKSRDSANEWRIVRNITTYPNIDSRYSDYLEPMVLLCLNTGLRRNELFNLKWVDINFDNSNLSVEGRTSKSGRTRHIPLNDEAQSILCDWQKQSDGPLVFASPVTGEKFENIKKSWTNLREKAGIPDFRFHDLRHTFASNLAMKGVDLLTIKELLGHSTIKMTEKYSHLAKNHKKEAVNKLSSQQRDTSKVSNLKQH